MIDFAVLTINVLDVVVIVIVLVGVIGMGITIVAAWAIDWVRSILSNRRRSD